MNCTTSREKIWEAILPLYQQAYGHVNGDTLHDAVIHVVENYDPSIGSLEHWFWASLKGWRMRKTLYDARRRKHLADVEPTPDQWRDRDRNPDARIDLALLTQRVDPLVRRLMQRCMEEGHTPSPVLRMFRRLLQVRRDPQLSSLPLFRQGR